MGKQRRRFAPTMQYQTFANEIRRHSRPWLPLWGSWRADGEPERACAVANLEWMRRLLHGTLSVTAFSRTSSPIGRAKGRLRCPAIYHIFPNRVTPNGVGLLPGSQARHSQRVQPALSVTAFSRDSSPIGRAKGRLRRPAIYHIFPNRVTPSGVGQLPGLQARIASGCNPPGPPKSPGWETGRF